MTAKRMQLYAIRTVLTIALLGLSIWAFALIGDTDNGLLLFFMFPLIILSAAGGFCLIMSVYPSYFDSEISGEHIQREQRIRHRPVITEQWKIYLIRVILSMLLFMSCTAGCFYSIKYVVVPGYILTVIAGFLVFSLFVLFGFGVFFLIINFGSAHSCSQIPEEAGQGKQHAGNNKKPKE